jgi:hypothetical protein
MGMDNFFNQYNKVNFIGGNLKDFSHSPQIEVAYYQQIFNDFNLRVSARYINGSLSDMFNETYLIALPDITRQLDCIENFTTSTIPVILSIEYMPFVTQYKTYVGAGIGLASSYFRWDETVTPYYNDIPRHGGTLFNQSNIVPCFNLYTGMELEFDGAEKGSFVHGVILEAELLHFHRIFNIFNKVGQQFLNPPSSRNDGFTMLPTYIVLNAGFVFNLDGF